MTMRALVIASVLCAAASSDAPKAPVLLDGLGDWHRAVRASPEAQRWFDQGLRLVYAFNHEEAIRSFERGAELDPQCAMCLWGIALALGPNINLPTDPDREKQAFETVRKAEAAAQDAVEKEYVAAVAKRYRDPPGPDRAALDRAYADAMRDLSRRHPEDVDAAVLFAESMMDLRPWDLWQKDGTSQPGTDELVAALEGALRRAPEHPGANHFYIHAVEASPHPEKALAAAKRLPALEPGAGHLVHMPAHVYIRTGRYEEASEANRQAIAVDRKYLQRTGAEGFYAMMYVAHNFQFLWAAAALQGRAQESIGAAREMASRFPTSMLVGMQSQMPGIDYLMAPPYLALVRFGRWDEMLKEPRPAPELRLLTGMWRFNRGMALAAKRQFAQAREEHARLAALAREIPDDQMVGPTNHARAIFQLAERMLTGEIAERAGRTGEAVRAFREAVRLEDALGYDEPPAWALPVRQWLGATLLAAGKAKEAEQVYREDLQRNPENGWSLYGLSKALTTQRASEAAAVHERFETAWARADVKLGASRF
jgi:tetratricopeptide (TPR) repeat protein